MTRLCWECGRKVHAKNQVVLEVDHHPRVLHSHCAELIQAGRRDLIPSDDQSWSFEGLNSLDTKVDSVLSTEASRKQKKVP